ncbi:penicillin-binding protein [Corynebacterium lizhenjunii]|uniref:Penicillin-binding protein n=1 Tax=Corynebacterium lizhenjunii TaxID=2709394 RepID=A0A7T0KHU6_9CORY|nr:transglycosylase domain-containing protein [Corynebacterium lizhenjunii]QPK80439.1 penicillin-binding protein [Corynebacterium lizhenjunii]
MFLAMVIIPLGLFGYAYSQYTVPRPEELASKQIATIYANDSTTQLARLVPPEGNRTHVTLDQVPTHMEDAVLAAEDREFWTNSGFSFTGFGRAVVGQLKGDDSAGGGSTITQQYVKNTLVGNERSYVRKARELVYSIKMTHEWDKETILNSYLNTVYFGRNAYGIQAASNAYFDKNVEDLTVEEAALLAGVIQAPSAWDPAVDPDASQMRWNYVLDGMVETGVLDAAERAGMQFPQTRNPAEYSAYTEATGANGHIKNQVIRELASVGISEEDVQTRGLQITTTIDMNVQNASLEAVDTALAPLQEDARAAAVTVDPATGAVRGYFGGHDANGWDYANAPLQTGSTFKIIGLAAALQQGIPLSTYYSSLPYQLPGTNIVVNNYDGSNGCGTCSIAESLKNSYNTPFQRLQEDLENKSQDTADMGHALGIAPSLPGIEHTLAEEGQRPFDGIILGQYPSRVVDMATVMATLTNDGVWHDTHFVNRVTTNTGEVLYERPDDKGQRRVSSQVARNVIEAMKPIAAWSNGALAGGRESAAKTGTSQLGDTGTNRDTWMIGSTPQLATAVWVGTADNTSAIFSAWGGNMFGSGAPTQIWKSILDTSLAEQEFASFPAASPVRYGTGTAGSGYSGALYGAGTWSGSSADTAGASAADAPSADAPAPAPEPAPAPSPAPAPAPGAGAGGGVGGAGGAGGGAAGGDGLTDLGARLGDALNDLLGQ